MPTINNMYNKLVSKLKMIPFIVLVFDLSNYKMVQLNHLDQIPARDNSFTIVLDQLHQSCSAEFPDTYYCMTMNELEEIITFVYRNNMMYAESVRNYEYDNLLLSDIQTIRAIEYKE